MNAEQFWQHVDRTETCWLWTAGRIGREHDRPIVRWNGRAVLGYHISLELEGIQVPLGHHVHHKCRQPLCVRPSHLAVLSPAEHARRHLKASCVHGHPFSGKNLGVVATGKNIGLRYCRTCLRLRARARAAQQASQKAA